MNQSKICLKVGQISTGFIEIPNQISLNIYAQGCKKRCKNCHNPELQSFSNGYEIYLSDVENIVSEYSLCDWICYLGGDVIYQPLVDQFNKEFKKFNKKICIYTGVDFSDLDEKILENIDLVKTGEWDQNLGSVKDEGTNQRFWLKKEGVWILIKNWDLLSIILKEEDFISEEILQNY